jgi:hypothetical protein
MVIPLFTLKWAQIPNVHPSEKSQEFLMELKKKMDYNHIPLKDHNN